MDSTISRSDPGLGPVGHIGLVVPDVAVAMATMAVCGVQWSSVQHPVARLRLTSGQLEEIEISYVAASGGEPRLKIIGGVSGTYFTPVSGVHHLSHWVDDVELSTHSLVAAGYEIEATAEELDGTARYRYLQAPGGLRVELGLRRNREEFDAWADGPRKDRLS